MAVRRKLRILTFSKECTDEERIEIPPKDQDHKVLAMPNKRYDKRQMPFPTRPEIEAILS
jgi:hypothetical protein